MFRLFLKGLFNLSELELVTYISYRQSLYLKYCYVLPFP